MTFHPQTPRQVEHHFFEDDDLVSKTQLRQPRQPRRRVKKVVSIGGWWWVAATIMMVYSHPITMTSPERRILAQAWTAEWIPVPHSSILPPRSGHVAFTLQDNQVYVFGGYAEQQQEGDETNDETTASTTTGMPTRYPINDLWVLDGDTMVWKCVHKANLWGTMEMTPTTTATTTAPRDGTRIPQQRLAAAAVGLTNKALVLGGWDSQEAGTGGVILNSIDMLELVSEGETARTDPVWKMDPSMNLGEPTSRQIAVALSDNTVLVHNHRCTDHVLIIELLDEEDDNKMTIRRQPTTGAAPSPRGLHAASACSHGSKVVVFGGAAQSGEMSNELFVLDTITWEWSEIKVDEDMDVPTPRASPCLCVLEEEEDHPLNETSQHSSRQATFVLFGGADRSLAEEGVALHGCNDLWLLHLSFLHDEGDPGESKTTMAKWERLLLPSLSPLPPGRNAATLTPLPNQRHTFVLQGGWYPFRKTHRETYLLKLKKD